EEILRAGLSQVLAQDRGPNTLRDDRNQLLARDAAGQQRIEERIRFVAPILRHVDDEQPARGNYRPAVAGLADERRQNADSFFVAVETGQAQPLLAAGLLEQFTVRSRLLLLLILDQGFSEFALSVQIVAALQRAGFERPQLPEKFQAFQPRRTR